MTSESAQEGSLYLIPISIGEADVDRYQPATNIVHINRIKIYVVENARTARQYIKSVAPAVDISSLTIYEADKHHDYLYPRTEVISKLKSGEDVALMSEAGCPAVADPGHHVVADCHEAGIRVVPLVGPSSILLSLMASGFDGQHFTFHGYLPYDNGERRQILLEWQRRVQRSGETHMFIEAPYRNEKLLRELTDFLSPSLKLCVAVDLTTAREEVTTLTVKEWSQRFKVKPSVSLHKRPTIFLIGR